MGVMNDSTETMTGPSGSSPERGSGARSRLLVLLTVVLVGVAAFALVWEARAVNARQAVPVPFTASAEQSALSELRGLPVYGSKGPVVTMFIDFECPHCEAFLKQQWSDLVAGANAGRWRLALVPIPLLTPLSGTKAQLWWAAVDLEGLPRAMKLVMPLKLLHGPVAQVAGQSRALVAEAVGAGALRRELGATVAPYARAKLVARSVGVDGVPWVEVNGVQVPWTALPQVLKQAR